MKSTNLLLESTKKIENTQINKIRMKEEALQLRAKTNKTINTARNCIPTNWITLK